MQNIAERNLRSIDLNLLVIFDALMAERNVTRAAARNGLSQPAVSKALNRLRGMFDDRLFVQRDRTMQPTARALELAGPIHGALANISQSLSPASRFDPNTAKATIRIATIDLCHTRLFPLLITRLRRYAPGVDLQVRASDCACLHDQMIAGDIDLAIAPCGTKAATIRSEPLWKDRLVTLAGPGNELSDRMTIEAFAAAPHLVDAGHVQVTPDGVGTSVVDAILAARGLRRRIALVLPNSAGIPFAVAATDLIATLPSRIVKGLARLPHIRLLTPPLPDVEVSPHMLWHSRVDADPSQRWLRAAIREIAAAV
jgi:DNA-binding transcriptional LysR family regulator